MKHKYKKVIVINEQRVYPKYTIAISLYYYKVYKLLCVSIGHSPNVASP